MKRKFILVVLLGVVLLCAPMVASAQESATQVPSDRITLEELKAMLADKKPVYILDVRLGVTTKIKGAAYIPLDQLEARLSELPTDREIVTYCS